LARHTVLDEDCGKGQQGFAPAARHQLAVWNSIVIALPRSIPSPPSGSIKSAIAATLGE